ncbi:MAG: protein phosphatase CheZ [Chromatiaceae bacterium]|nr:protein phosphatase CheZ [Gammaproteobacteria bacterium]MCP5446207.1 protein phosphatase CheZ [Chromatiaceae bacterium]MCB1861703.1 protein phosphatase CheZ [Gammaproteobacteria bacterium]MCB1873803.1 protein phosphatase CheZ [Gammaproteobacteria bacterium]MCB1879460.1 protein phosphatase CheZ [Gammaproteobacteria bacterium]
MASVMESDKRLELARQLVDQLEAGHSVDAERTIDQLTGFSENNLFQEVGRLTRELHSAINNFLLDSRIAEIAKREIPDASERLNYVITMTENAANTSLGAVEAGLPLTDELGSSAKVLATDWKRFQERELSVEEFRVLAQKLAGFLKTTEGHSGVLHSKLSEVLMAQDFQDLTGQIIRQVITLIQDVEGKLVSLVRISGGVDATANTRLATKLEGPAVPGIIRDDQVSGQDDVDDLLSSLGF